MLQISAALSLSYTCAGIKSAGSTAPYILRLNAPAAVARYFLRTDVTTLPAYKIFNILTHRSGGNKACMSGLAIGTITAYTNTNPTLNNAVRINLYVNPKNESGKAVFVAVPRSRSQPSCITTNAGRSAPTANIKLMANNAEYANTCATLKSVAVRMIPGRYVAVVFATSSAIVPRVTVARRPARESPTPGERCGITPSRTFARDIVDDDAGVAARRDAVATVNAPGDDDRDEDARFDVDARVGAHTGARNANMARVGVGL